MSPVYVIVSLAVTAAVSAVLSYLYSRSAGARDTAARQVAEEQSRLAREQAVQLRAERDQAVERAEAISRANTELVSDRRGLDERLGRASADLDATRVDLSKAEKEAQRLRAQMEAGDLRVEEGSRAIQQAEREIAAGRAREELFRQESEQLKVQIADVLAKNAAMEKESVSLEAVREQLDLTRDDNDRLQRENLQAMTEEMLKRSKEDLVKTAETALTATSAPVQERLGQLEQRLRDFDGKRLSAEAQLKEQLASLSKETFQSREQTRSLVEALRQPQVRGQWGEMHLKRTAELAGLQEHCDFDLQVSVSIDNATLRPDMVVHLAGGKHVVVDAKVPLAAFLKACDATDPAERARHLADHAKQVRKHVDSLAGKEYFRGLPSTPEYVVMYLPGDAVLQPALDQDPTLMEYAAAKRVLIATPTIMIGLLRTVAYTWTQAAFQDSMREVHELGRELYDRLAKLGGHFTRLGNAIGRTVGAYNDTVGSLEGRVLVTARKMEALKAVEPGLGEVPRIEEQVRSIAVAEFKTAEAR